MLSTLPKANALLKSLLRMGETILLLLACGTGYLLVQGLDIVHSIKSLPLRMKTSLIKICTRLLLIKVAILKRFRVPQNDKDSLLIKAVSAGEEHNVEVFLQRGASPNVKGITGVNVLFIAVFYNQVNIARLLLHYGADIEAKMPITRSIPLLLASQNQLSEMVELLLEHGATP